LEQKAGDTQEVFVTTQEELVETMVLPEQMLLGAQETETVVVALTGMVQEAVPPAPVTDPL
jgi:hypothetical protein